MEDTQAASSSSRPPIGLEIWSAHADGEAWDQQLELIRRSGATFDRDARAWHNHVAPEDPSAVLDPLFEAARRFGTIVRVVEPLQRQ